MNLPSILDFTVKNIAWFLQKIFLSDDGKRFVQNRSNYISELVERAQRDNKSFISTFIINCLSVYKTSLCVLLPSAFTAKSIENITSGTDDPWARTTFQPFAAMFGISNKSPVSWVLQQNKESLLGRKKLMLFLAPNERLNEIVSRKLKIALDHQDEGPCLYKWLHQLNIEIIAEHVLGMAVPKYTADIIDLAEDVIVHETPPFKILSKNVALTDSQKKFELVRSLFQDLAANLIQDNRDEILNGCKYLSALLRDESKQRNLSLLDALNNIEVQISLRAAACGLLLAVANLSTALTVALLHLDNGLLSEIKGSENLFETTTSFLDCYFKEALRYSSGAGQIARFSSFEKNMEQSMGGEQIKIPKNSVIFFALRSANHSNWCEENRFMPKRFLDKETPKLNSEEFLPFSLGPRMCPGRHLAEAVFKQIINYFIDNELSVSSTNPEDKDLSSCSLSWTTKDFVTRPVRAIAAKFERNDLVPTLGL